MPANIWIDVEDLFEYARQNSRPSGIQRLAFEIHQALLLNERCAGQIHFVRHAPYRSSFRVVGWPEVAGLFADLTDTATPPSATLGAALPHRRARARARKLVQLLPASFRARLTAALLASRGALQAWGGLLGYCMRAPVQAARRRLRRQLRVRTAQRDAARMPAARIDFATAIAPGDVILVLGSPWFHPDYAAMIRAHRERHGVRFAILVYDLIPIRRPEWCDSGLVRLFREWFVPILPLCDHVFAISHATADDVADYARSNRIALPHGIVTIPIGTGLGSTQLPSPEKPAIVRPLPLPGSYALIVSTIEARKNHLLLFRVWRRLLEEMPGDLVPTLVFAGRIGWLVDDLMHQIRNTAYLDGRLVVVESPTDAELAALYGGCLFTLFPSFYEGWGLPVSESLAFGKPCLISNRTSLPEAGGSLARQFDPDNLHDAYAAIRAVIQDRPGLARWQDEVRRSFVPVPWSATADALLDGLERPDEFGQDPPVAVPGLTSAGLVMP